MAAPTSIFISAGEASGDLYGALLIAALRQKTEPVEFFGLGGEKMRQAGCETVVDAHQIAMVGIVEVIPGLPRVWKAFRRLIKTIKERRPALAVLIDFPDFNLRLAKKLKQAGIPVVYFIAPQAWAWRPGRVSVLRDNVDRLLCIFPFEEKFFRKAGVRAEFVGHPLVNRVSPSLDAVQFRAKLGIPQEALLVALLPGSRRREISLNLPPILQSAQAIVSQRGNGTSTARKYVFLIPAASAEAAEEIRKGLRNHSPGGPDRFLVVENQTYDAVAHAAAAVVASGTATVETALLGTVMVVVYRVTGLSWFLGRWLVKIPFLSMVNLVAERQVVPEYIQKDFQPAVVAAAVQALLENTSAREEMRAGLRDVVLRLNSCQTSGSAGADEAVDPIQRSVAVIEEMLATRRES